MAAIHLERQATNDHAALSYECRFSHNYGRVVRRGLDSCQSKVFGVEILGPHLGLSNNFVRFSGDDAFDAFE